MSSQLQIKTASIHTQDSRQAVKQLAEAISQEGMQLVIFFCSSQYDLTTVAQQIKKSFNCPAIGCSSAGEITSAGYQQNTLIGMSIRSSALHPYPRLIRNLDGFDYEAAQQLINTLPADSRLHTGQRRQQYFGLLLIDALPQREEQIVAGLNQMLPNIPLAGGSAADNLQFKKCAIYWDGQFISNAACYTLFETSLPFTTFQTQHFETTDIRLVVTGSEGRCIHQLNARPAAQAYAQAINIRPEQLTPQIFAQHPLMLRIGNDYFLRAIQRLNPDNSLQLYCAIDDGLVLRIGRPQSLLDNLQQHIDRLKQLLPGLQLILGCDCILRRLELEQQKLLPQASRLLADVPIFGFNCYGEQLNGIHTSQTLTGIALGDST